MFKRFSTNYLTLLFLLDLILIQAAMGAALILRYVLPLERAIPPELAFSFRPSLHLALLLLWTVSFLVVGVYTPRKIIVWVAEFQHVALAHTLAVPTLAGVLYLAKPELQLPRLTLVYFYILAMVSLLGYRVALRVWYRLNRLRSEFVARILVVGAGKVGREVVQQIQDYPGLGIKLIGFLDDNPKKVGTSVVGLPVLGQVDQIPTFMVRYAVDEVLITLPLRAHARLANLLNLLWNYPVRVRVVPDFSDLLFYGATLDSLGGVPLIGLRDPVIDDFQRFVKRLVDIVLSALGLLLMAPVMLATAIAIRLNGDGPIFYRADRVGENGRLFKMYKFRSMVTNADKMQNLVNRSDGQGNTFHKIAEDPRITPVGRFIRRTSIDELPQLINVLKGDMSLVGPRPELPWLVEKYEAWQRKRFAVPQGVTGWWQINGRSNKPMHLNTSQDLYYIQNYSLWLDIQIMWKTIAAVLRRNGAY